MVLHQNNTPVLKYTLILATIWTLVLGYLSIWIARQHDFSYRQQALSQARAHFNRDLAFRLWATSHGKIYLPVGDNYQPDPFLAHIPERDIVTPSGLQLSLVNPARIIRDLDTSYRSLNGVRRKITSLNPLHPENVPDEWERKALSRFENGIQEVFEFATIGLEPHLRLIRPVTMQPGCLQCHDGEAGSIAGGVSIYLPLNEQDSQLQDTLRLNTLSFGLIWLLGLAALAYGHFHIGRQITTRRQAISDLIKNEARKSAMMEAALDCIVTIDANGLIIEFNSAAEETFGYARSEVLGLPLADALIPLSLREKHATGMRHHLETGTSRLLDRRIETIARHADGSEFPVELAISRIDVENEVLFTAYLRDITESKEMEELLTFQARHDRLTGLVNRSSFEEQLREILLGNDDDHCLMFLDLDQFKIVNDTCGHAAGDELLCQLSSLMQDNIRGQDILARLGGDEFGIILKYCNEDAAGRIADKLIRSVVNYRFHWEEKVFSVGLSIGLVTLYGLDLGFEELIGSADAACYKAKEDGGNRHYRFHENDKDLARRRGELGWISNIQTAIEEDRFRLYRQTILPLQYDSDSHPEMFEILIRMTDAQGKLTEPSQFIAAAERYHLMPHIDRWVIGSLFSWLAKPESKECICSINLSGRTISDPHFADYVKEQLDRYAIPPRQICFEITETAAITNLTKARHLMNELSAIGCLFALDDFGSGMSSFGYLRHLPVDYLKIDGEFVQDMLTDEISLAMVRSINEIGRIMGKQTIAERADDAEIIESLRENGIVYAQGFAIDRPRPLEPIA